MSYYPEQGPSAGEFKRESQGAGMRVNPQQNERDFDLKGERGAQMRQMSQSTPLDLQGTKDTINVGDSYSESLKKQNIGNTKPTDKLNLDDQRFQSQNKFDDKGNAIIDSYDTNFSAEEVGVRPNENPSNTAFAQSRMQSNAYPSQKEDRNKQTLTGQKNSDL